MYSTKHLGRFKRDQRRAKKREMDALKAKVNPAPEESDEPDEEDEALEEMSESSEEVMAAQKEQPVRPTQSYDYIEKIAEMYSNKKKVAKVADSDSDDQGAQPSTKAGRLKATCDKRILFINEKDAGHFKTEVQKPGSSSQLWEEEVQKRTSKVRGLNQDKEAQLPIIFHEREIMENIENNVVTIVCGETGSGKSTQIPQFIYKAVKTLSWKFRNSRNASGENSLLVGITQPRRVAAVSLAKRVSEELGTELGQEVGYQIRYDSEFFNKDKTSVKFMTDGILLKEIESDFLLKHYSVIIIDEAHERSLNSDILISLLTRIAHARCEKAFKER